MAEEANATMDVLLHGWLTTILTDHDNIAGLNQLFEYKSWDLRDVMEAYEDGSTYPLEVNILSTNTTASGVVPQASANYFRLNVPSGSGSVSIQLQNGNGAPVSFAGAHLYVVRLQ